VQRQTGLPSTPCSRPWPPRPPALATIFATQWRQHATNPKRRRERTTTGPCRRARRPPLSLPERPQHPPAWSFPRAVASGRAAGCRSRTAAHRGCGWVSGRRAARRTPGCGRVGPGFDSRDARLRRAAGSRASWRAERCSASVPGSSRVAAARGRAAEGACKALRCRTERPRFAVGEKGV